MKNRIILVAFALALLVSGCAKKKVSFGKLDKTPYATKECQKELNRGREYRGTPIAKIVVNKKKRQMLTYNAKGKQMHEFRISLGKNGDKGNKVRAGDYRTPEGSYRIVRKKCDNRLYKSLMISYPNSADRKRARRKGVSPGGYITIHGQPKWNADGRGDSYTLAHDWTEGCMAVPNKAMDALWAAVHNGVKINIRS
jgi:murein L,D-transpeptidase YafK